MYIGMYVYNPLNKLVRMIIQMLKRLCLNRGA